MPRKPFVRINVDQADQEQDRLHASKRAEERPDSPGLPTQSLTDNQQHILALQSTHGNAYVRRLLTRQNQRFQHLADDKISTSGNSKRNPQPANPSYSPSGRTFGGDPKNDTHYSDSTKAVLDQSAPGVGNTSDSDNKDAMTTLGQGLIDLSGVPEISRGMGKGSSSTQSQQSEGGEGDAPAPGPAMVFDKDGNEVPLSGDPNQPVYNQSGDYLGTAGELQASLSQNNQGITTEAQATAEQESQMKGGFADEELNKLGVDQQKWNRGGIDSTQDAENAQAQQQKELRGGIDTTEAAEKEKAKQESELRGGVDTVEEAERLKTQQEQEKAQQNAEKNGGISSVEEAERMKAQQEKELAEQTAKETTPPAKTPEGTLDPDAVDKSTLPAFVLAYSKYGGSVTDSIANKGRQVTLPGEGRQQPHYTLDGRTRRGLMMGRLKNDRITNPLPDEIAPTPGGQPDPGTHVTGNTTQPGGDPAEETGDGKLHRS